MPVKIFASYALKDKEYIASLKIHLGLLRRQGLIEAWYDHEIDAGAVWARELDKQLNTADIILLFISPSFMALNNSFSKEIQRAIERHERGEARVIPIILRPVDWIGTPLSKLQALPTDAKPIRSSGWHNQDEALDNVIVGLRKIIEELLTIEFSIEQGDITSFDADVLALKYAQRFFGTDEIIAHLLSKTGIAISTLCPDIGDYRYVDTRNSIQAHYALFIGVPDILEFNYQHIQEFAMLVLNTLAYHAPDTKHLAMTIHGVGFGLDEIEAFLAQFRGYLHALQSGQFPIHLEKITIIEHNWERVQRLQEAFDINFSNADFVSTLKDRRAYRINRQRLISNFKGNQLSYNVGDKKVIESEAKRHVFVAMPFKSDMDDVFYYGIQQPVRSAGFICERIDQEAFIGGIIDQVKNKIETAAVVIAELSGANPNVYLEVGYAWGKGRPTILLVKDEQELRFDLRDQRCLKYESIRNLEEALSRELNELKSKGFI